MPFDKHEIGILERALERTLDHMRGSTFTGPLDPHYLKCEAVRAKLGEMKAEL